MAKVCCHYRGTAGRRATLCINPNETCPQTFGGLNLVSSNNVQDGCRDCFQSGSAVAEADPGSVDDAGSIVDGSGSGSDDESDS